MRGHIFTALGGKHREHRTGCTVLYTGKAVFGTMLDFSLHLCRGLERDDPMVSTPEILGIKPFLQDANCGP